MREKLQRLGLLSVLLTVLMAEIAHSQEVHHFRIAAEHENGEIAFSNQVKAEPTFTLYIPEAFTPNGDGLNDVFKVVSLEYDRYHIVIYDRWGDKVFESYQAENGWDGRKNGTLLPIGAYVYQLTITSKGGLDWSKTGQVILAKN